MGMNDNGCVCVVEIKGEQYVEYKSYENRVNDLCRQIEELESELEVKDNLLKIKNGLCGNDEEKEKEPIEIAADIIRGRSKNDLEQIAQHIQIYCRHISSRREHDDVIEF